jgi:hypothetical protein
LSRVSVALDTGLIFCLYLLRILPIPPFPSQT